MHVYFTYVLNIHIYICRCTFVPIYNYLQVYHKINMPADHFSHDAINICIILYISYTHVRTYIYWHMHILHSIFFFLFLIRNDKDIVFIHEFSNFFQGIKWGKKQFPPHFQHTFFFLLPYLEFKIKINENGVFQNPDQTKV